MNLNVDTELFYNPNSYSSSFISIASDNSIEDISNEENITSPSYIPRLSIISNNTIHIQSNDIYERKKYIQFIIDQNTYLNNTKYQKKFNKIIFNFNI